MENNDKSYPVIKRRRIKPTETQMRYPRGMKITIHRGTDQIGGCVTEYEVNGWHLFVDYGEQLSDAPQSEKPFEVEGLTHGDTSRSALLITHYHTDHTGRITELPQSLPIYMGKIACEILALQSERVGQKSAHHRKLAERLQTVKHFAPGESFDFGDFKILPIVVDHSAFDAYAFKIEGDGVEVFHTGDFRTHGFRGAALPKVIEKYIGKVDYVVCEGTNISDSDKPSKSEHELQQEFEQEFHRNKYNVVYLSSTNIDRLFGVYHAALRAGRPFYVDEHQRRMMDIVTQRDRKWGKSRLYKYGKYEPTPLKENRRGFSVAQEFKDFLSKKGYVLIARAGDKFDNLISQLPGEKKTYLSMWGGYLEETKAAYLPALAKSVGKGYIPKHASGHCDMDSLGNLFAQLSPRAIIPIHTTNPKAFAERFCDRWPVMLLHDGESFSTVNNLHDDVTAGIFTMKKPDDDVEAFEVEGDYQWWGMSDRCIGEFRCMKDALTALKHTVYAPGRVVGYEVLKEEDSAPWDVDVYNPDFSISAKYKYGHHAPGGSAYQEKCRFNAGDIVWAAVYEYYAFVPCRLIGPVTEELMRKICESNEHCDQSYEEIKKMLWDWDWDAVAVHPLVKLKNKYGSMDDIILVQRIYLFPYKEYEV